MEILSNIKQYQICYVSCLGNKVGWLNWLLLLWDRVRFVDSVGAVGAVNPFVHFTNPRVDPPRAACKMLFACSTKVAREKVI